MLLNLIESHCDHDSSLKPLSRIADRNSRVRDIQYHTPVLNPLTVVLQDSFADGHMTDAMRNLSNDSGADKRVKKKLLMVLGSWREKYKDDPSMSLVAGLHKQCRGAGPRVNQGELSNLMGLTLPTEEKRRTHKQEAKRTEKQEIKKRAKLEKERAKNEEDRYKKRVPFNFEKVKFSYYCPPEEGS